VTTDRAAGDSRAPRKPGVVAVARAASVSPSTVSNAFNRPERLVPELRERVLRTAAELGYGGPDPAARSLRSGRAGAIGVILGRLLADAFDDAATAQFLRGVSDVTDPQQLAVVLIPGMPDERASVAPAIRNAAADGLIVFSLPGDDPLIDAVRARRLPTVIVDSPAISDIPGLDGEPRHDELDFVGTEDAAGAEAAVRHLLELGHRRLGLLSFALHDNARPGAIDLTQHAHATASVTKARLEGSCRALAAARLDAQSVPVEQVPVVNAELGRAAAHALLDRAPGITAVFAFSDRLALAARQAARERGLAVPGDLSIVGFDDTAPDFEGLTTIHQPMRDKGRIAAQRLLHAVRHEPLASRSERLPTRLVVRDSTAPPGGLTPGAGCRHAAVSDAGSR
jgi:DNA-binding LacI/PurR family transcriptional regulator